MNALSNWPRNRLLIALPSRNLKQLMPELEHIRCQRDQVLMDADSSLDHVFFPDGGVVSVVAVYADGSVIEMATPRYRTGNSNCDLVSVRDSRPNLNFTAALISWPRVFSVLLHTKP
jgi:hypothetical protein